MEIQQHMKIDVKTCTEGESVTSAARNMARYDIGALVVVKGDKPVGIFTERDLLKRVVADGKDPATVKVGDVMTGDFVSINPATTVGIAYHICVEKNIRHIPVVKDGRLVGIVSMKDLGKILDDRFYSTYFGRHQIRDLSGDY